ncbi:Cylicin-2, partial [Ophiophagus hannah]
MTGRKRPSNWRRLIEQLRHLAMDVPVQTVVVRRDFCPGLRPFLATAVKGITAADKLAVRIPAKVTKGDHVSPGRHCDRRKYESHSKNGKEERHKRVCRMWGQPIGTQTPDVTQSKAGVSNSSPPPSGLVFAHARRDGKGGRGRKTKERGEGRRTRKREGKRRKGKKGLRREEGIEEGRDGRRKGLRQEGRREGWKEGRNKGIEAGRKGLRREGQRKKKGRRERRKKEGRKGLRREGKRGTEEGWKKEIEAGRKGREGLKKEGRRKEGTEEGRKHLATTGQTQLLMRPSLKSSLTPPHTALKPLKALSHPSLRPIAPVLCKGHSPMMMIKIMAHITPRIIIICHGKRRKEGACEWSKSALSPTGHLLDLPVRHHGRPMSRLKQNLSRSCVICASMGNSAWIGQEKPSHCFDWVSFLIDGGNALKSTHLQVARIENYCYRSQKAGITYIQKTTRTLWLGLLSRGIFIKGLMDHLSNQEILLLRDPDHLRMQKDPDNRRDQRGRSAFLPRARVSLFFWTQPDPGISSPPTHSKTSLRSSRSLSCSLILLFPRAGIGNLLLWNRMWLFHPPAAAPSPVGKRKKDAALGGDSMEETMVEGTGLPVLGDSMEETLWCENWTSRARRRLYGGRTGLPALGDSMVGGTTLPALGDSMEEALWWENQTSSARRRLYGGRTRLPTLGEDSMVGEPDFRNDARWHLFNLRGPLRVMLVGLPGEKTTREGGNREEEKEEGEEEEEEEVVLHPTFKFFHQYLRLSLAALGIGADLVHVHSHDIHDLEGKRHRGEGENKGRILTPGRKHLQKNPPSSENTQRTPQSSSTSPPPFCKSPFLFRSDDVPWLGHETSARKPPSSDSTNDPTVLLLNPFLPPPPPPLCKSPLLLALMMFSSWSTKPSSSSSPSSSLLSKTHSFLDLMMFPSWVMKRLQGNPQAQRAPRTPQKIDTRWSPPSNRRMLRKTYLG